MIIANHGSDPSESTESSRSLNLIGTLLPATGRRKQHPTIQPKTLARNAPSPPDYTEHPWPFHHPRVSSTDEMAMHTVKVPASAGVRAKLPRKFPGGEMPPHAKHHHRECPTTQSFRGNSLGTKIPSHAKRHHPGGQNAPPRKNAPSRGWPPPLAWPCLPAQKCPSTHRSFLGPPLAPPRLRVLHITYDP